MLQDLKLALLSISQPHDSTLQLVLHADGLHSDPLWSMVDEFIAKNEQLSIRDRFQSKGRGEQLKSQNITCNKIGVRAPTQPHFRGWGTQGSGIKRPRSVGPRRFEQKGGRLQLGLYDSHHAVLAVRVADAWVQTGKLMSQGWKAPRRRTSPADSEESQENDDYEEFDSQAARNYMGGEGCFESAKVEELKFYNISLAEWKSKKLKWKNEKLLHEKKGPGTARAERRSGEAPAVLCQSSRYFNTLKPALESPKLITPSMAKYEETFLYLHPPTAHLMEGYGKKPSDLGLHTSSPDILGNVRYWKFETWTATNIDIR
ncbi:hypothetical protein B0H14DRAFT_2576512 [Mycena olivaceomarginata]|nr:hypothetical protein B0H14DRAFT_2576512 [Mycena olivaceomarginata]